MTRFKFKLGDEVQDSVTDLCGIITGRTEYLNGCIQYGIEQKQAVSKRYEKEYHEIKPIWLDEGRLKRIGGGINSKAKTKPPVTAKKRNVRGALGGPHSTPSGLNCHG